MKLWDAKKIGERVKDMLAPYCDKIEIAGSVRREVAHVRDLEIVAQPKFEYDLFGKCLGASADFMRILNGFEKIKGEACGKYTRRKLPELDNFFEPIECDFFIARPENFGWLLALRTGSSSFNKYYWLAKLKAAGFVSVAGVIRKISDSSLVEIPDEETLFNLIGGVYIPPYRR